MPDAARQVFKTQTLNLLASAGGVSFMLSSVHQACLLELKNDANNSEPCFGKRGSRGRQAPVYLHNIEFPTWCLICLMSTKFTREAATRF